MCCFCLTHQGPRAAAAGASTLPRRSGLQPWAQPATLTPVTGQRVAATFPSSVVAALKCSVLLGAQPPQHRRDAQHKPSAPGLAGDGQGCGTLGLRGCCGVWGRIWGVGACMGYGGHVWGMGYVTSSVQNVWVPGQAGGSTSCTGASRAPRRRHTDRGTCCCFWFAPLHKGTAPAVTAAGRFPRTNTPSLATSQSFILNVEYFFCMWSSFVYLLEKIRKVPRERVFLLIPISYLELHYQHLLSPSWGLKLKQNMNIDTNILPLSAQAAHMTHSSVGMRRRKAAS